MDKHLPCSQHSSWEIPNEYVAVNVDYGSWEGEQWEWTSVVRREGRFKNCLFFYMVARLLDTELIAVSVDIPCKMDLFEVEDKLLKGRLW